MSTALSNPIFTLHLHILDTDTEIKTLVRLPVVFGRFDTETGYQPEIDLEAHDGAESGVSRRHLMLYPDSETFRVKDLNSTNGSFINGVALKPNVVYAIHSGDELVVGHLRMRVLYERFQEAATKSAATKPVTQPVTQPEDAPTLRAALTPAMAATVTVPSVMLPKSEQETVPGHLHETPAAARRVSPLAQREVYTPDQQQAMAILRKIAVNKEISENMLAYLAARATQEAEWSVNRRLAVLKTACEYGYVARDNAELMREQRRMNEIHFGQRE